MSLGYAAAWDDLRRRRRRLHYSLALVMGLACVMFFATWGPTEYVGALAVGVGCLLFNAAMAGVLTSSDR